MNDDYPYFDEDTNSEYLGDVETDDQEEPTVIKLSDIPVGTTELHLSVIDGGHMDPIARVYFARR